jgi:hypothetical protein
LPVARNRRLFFVLVSDLNINRDDLAPILQHKGKMRNSDIFVLTHDVHPNDYRFGVQPGVYPTVDEDALTALEKVLTQA